MRKSPQGWDRDRSGVYLQHVKQSVQAMLLCLLENLYGCILSYIPIFFHITDCLTA